MEQDAVKAVRFSRPGDEPALKALWKVVFGDEDRFIDTFFQTIYTPGSAAVAEVDGFIAAAAYVIPFGAARYIYAVGTHPDYRGRGLGKAVTLAAADGKAAYLCPADASLADWYAREMGAEPVSYRRNTVLPTGLAPIPRSEYAARREALLAGTPHTEYTPEILALFSLNGGFFAGEDGSVYAAEDGLVREALPAEPGGEPYIWGLNGAPPIYWGITLI